MARVVRRWAGSLTGVALLALASCSGAGPAAQVPRTPDPEQAVRDECRSTLPADAEIRTLTLAGATDGRLQALEFSSSGTRASLVLLPQVGGGVCGWATFAHEAAELGFPSIVVAPCSYGESTCSEEGDADPLNEVAPAIAALEQDFATERVVLVGASMGGSLTVLASAAGADADAWVDVSGPATWEGTELASVSADLPRPGMVVMARSDGAAAYQQAKLLARRSGATFLDGGSGHGYELVVNLQGRISRVGRVLLAFAEG